MLITSFNVWQRSLPTMKLPEPIDTDGQHQKQFTPNVIEIASSYEQLALLR